MGLRKYWTIPGPVMWELNISRRVSCSKAVSCLVWEEGRAQEEMMAAKACLVGGER